MLSRNFKEGRYWYRYKGKHKRLRVDMRHQVMVGLPSCRLLLIYHPWKGIPYATHHGLTFKNGVWK